MSGWRKRTIMEMARETKMPYDFVTGEPINLEKLEAFAKLVREDERNRTWTQEHWTDYERSIAAIEREACVKECKKLIKVFLSSKYSAGQPLSSFKERHAVAACIEAIQERGQA